MRGSSALVRDTEPSFHRRIAASVIHSHGRIGVGIILACIPVGLPREGGVLGNRGNLNVHHGACDRLPQPGGSWDLSAGARRQFESGGNDHGRMPWITRFRVSEGVLGASCALSRMEIQGLGVPNRQPRPA